LASQQLKCGGECKTLSASLYYGILKVRIAQTQLFIIKGRPMTITTTDIKHLIKEKLTATDKADIERMIRSQLKDELAQEVTKSVEKVVKDELKAAMSDKATQKEMADISKKIIKKLYKDLSFHHPYIIDRIKI